MTMQKQKQEASEIIVDYIGGFRTKLDCVRICEDLRAQCSAQGDFELIDAMTAIGDCDIADTESAFRQFLINDGDAVEFVAEGHETSLAAFDAIDSPLAQIVKEACRQMLISEYAVWSAHKRLLDAALVDDGVIDELSENDDMNAILESQGGFALHEQLSFCEIWEELYR